MTAAPAEWESQKRFLITIPDMAAEMIRPESNSYGNRAT
jgi:hypothetical protein